MNIIQNYQALASTLPVHVQLVGVSKFHPEEAIYEAYQAGLKQFGESRVQELVQKQAKLPKDIEWHFIGHLQTNKIKTVLPLVKMIQSLDSIHLIEAVEKEAAKMNIHVDGLLQVHIAQESTKFGFSMDEVKPFFHSELFHSLRFLHVVGLMGMATYTDDQQQIRSEFKSLHRLFTEMKEDVSRDERDFSVLSMGMTNDYLIAVEEGSTMVRIGTALFGLRPCALV
ncbi:MAG: YggS family pyridoxal phosphate-dependent enzyme [Microbacter sp.]